MAEAKEKIANDIFKSLIKLRGVAGMFFCPTSNDERLLTEPQSNGIYFLLDSISDDLESIQGEINKL